MESLWNCLYFIFRYQGTIPNFTRSKTYIPRTCSGKQRANCNWTLLKTCIVPKPCGQMPPNLNSRHIIKFTTTLVYNLEHENHYIIAQIVILLKLSRNQRIIKLYDNISFKHCNWPNQLDQHVEHVKRTLRSYHVTYVNINLLGLFFLFKCIGINNINYNMCPEILIKLQRHIHGASRLP
jgi:hypothetical protein